MNNPNVTFTADVTPCPNDEPNGEESNLTQKYCRNQIAGSISGTTFKETIRPDAAVALGLEAVDPSKWIDEIPSIWDLPATEMKYYLPLVLPMGSVVGLTGESGDGKSMTSLSFVRDVKVPVLIFDCENPLYAVRARCEWLGIERDDRIKHAGGWLLEKTKGPDESVIDWIKKHHGKVVIVIDSFTGFFDGDENDAGSMRKFMHRCRLWANLGATVIVIHHRGRNKDNGDYRGSSDFKASIDIGIAVTKVGNGPLLEEVNLKWFKNRFGALFSMRYFPQTGKLISYKCADGSPGVAKGSAPSRRNHATANPSERVPEDAAKDDFSFWPFLNYPRSNLLCSLEAGRQPA